MKSLLYFVASLAFVVLSITSASAQLTVIKNSGTEKIEVVFNRKLTFNDLVKIKLDLSERGISLIYKKLEFDENGGLEIIDFFVDTQNGFKGGAALSHLNNQRHWGFYRDFTEGAEKPFGTGDF